MKERRVVFAPEAAEDLIEIYDWIAQVASHDVAIEYIGRIEGFCQRLSIASERGHLRAAVRPGLRMIGFERRVTIAFTVGDDTVVTPRALSGGRNWEASF